MDTFTPKRLAIASQATSSATGSPVPVAASSQQITVAVTVNVPPPLPQPRKNREGHWIDIKQLPKDHPVELYAPIHGYTALY